MLYARSKLHTIKLKVRALRLFTWKITDLLLSRGVIGTILFSVNDTRRITKSFFSLRVRTKQISHNVGKEFDNIYGVDTSGVISIHNLNVSSKNWIYSARYQPIDIVGFFEVLKGLNLPCEQFVFIDLGSGKGRAILLASALSFKEIIGVEFSDELNRIAEDNVRHYPNAAKNCKKITLKCMDASRFHFPEDPFVLYMFNPFGRPVMKRIVEHVISAFEKRPRRIVVLYFTPKCTDLWDGVDFLRRIQTNEKYNIYDTITD